MATRKMIPCSSIGSFINRDIGIDIDSFKLYNFLTATIILHGFHKSLQPRKTAIDFIDKRKVKS